MGRLPRGEYLETFELGPRRDLQVRRGLEVQIDSKLDRSLAMEAARKDQSVDVRLSVDGAEKGLFRHA